MEILNIKQREEVIATLEKMGYKNSHNLNYDKDGCKRINLSYISSIEQLMTAMYEAGKTDKLWEIKKVLE